MKILRKDSGTYYQTITQILPNLFPKYPRNIPKTLPT